MTIIYKSNDGMLFNTAFECVQHEKENSLPMFDGNLKPVDSSLNATYVFIRDDEDLNKLYAMENRFVKDTQDKDEIEAAKKKLYPRRYGLWRYSMDVYDWVSVEEEIDNLMRVKQTLEKELNYE